MVISYKTITSIFMVPTLKIPRNSLYENNFLNAYLKDINKEEYYKENIIFLLFKPEDLNKFSSFLNNQYENNKSIIEDYDYDNGYVVLVYLLNNEFNDDFNLIKKGKYSKVSEKFKNIFPEKIKILNNSNESYKRSLQWLIFEKNEQLIDYIENMIGSDMISKYDLEVWPGFDLNKETLNINEIIKNEKHNK